MKLKSTSCLLIILAFIIFIGTNEDSYAKGKKKKAKMQIEMEEYGDVGLITALQSLKQILKRNSNGLMIKQKKKFYKELWKRWIEKKRISKYFL